MTTRTGRRYLYVSIDVLNTCCQYSNIAGDLEIKVKKTSKIRARTSAFAKLLFLNCQSPLLLLFHYIIDHSHTGYASAQLKINRGSVFTPWELSIHAYGNPAPPANVGGIDLVGKYCSTNRYWVHIRQY